VFQGIAVTAPITSEAVGTNTVELNQIEPMFSLAFEQILSEIQNTCHLLAIATGKYIIITIGPI